MIPLTHHDVVRHAAPLVRAGLRIDPAATERSRRRIVFHPRVRSDDDSLHALYTLSVLADGDVELVRAVADAPSGLVSTLIASAAAPGPLVETFERIPPERQIARDGDIVTARSWTLEPVDGPDTGTARLELRQIVGRSGPLVLIVDVSTGAGMPADAILARHEDWTDHLRETLASGATVPQRQFASRHLLGSLPSAPPERASPDAAARLAALPDDVLAVLGPQWRPLVWQGTRWKGVMRLLGREPARGERASRYAREALTHLATVVSEAPSRYHAHHAARRRRVFVRRLRPAMALLAILAVMPLSWWAVARGGAEMHPLVLGLTPLLMVAVVMLSAREIPVLEIPPVPRPLRDDAWAPASTKPGPVPSTDDIIRHADDATATSGSTRATDDGTVVADPSGAAGADDGARA